MGTYCTNRHINDEIRLRLQDGWSIDMRGRHLKLRSPKGALVIISRSPSDHRAIRNILSDLRKVERNDPKRTTGAA